MFFVMFFPLLIDLIWFDLIDLIYWLTDCLEVYNKSQPYHPAAQH